MANESEENVSGQANDALGKLVADVIGEPDRYALSHVLLAALESGHAITTNFDALYEKAVEAVTGKPVAVVLPEGGTARPEGDTGWLLKLHGDAAKPSTIVLDRRAFVRYDAMHRPLGSVLQATLLTRHLLIVGASMTDDNVIRLLHEVAALNEEHGRDARLGTVLDLQEDKLKARLWDPELTYVPMGPERPAGESDDQASERRTAAGRRLDVFLDLVAEYAAAGSAHLLDVRYQDLLDDGQRDLARRLAAMAAEVAAAAEASSQAGEWGEVLQALRGWGARL